MSRSDREAQSTSFYDRTAIWYGTTEISARDLIRARIIDSIPGGPHRVLEIGAGFGGAAAATADLGHTVLAIERSAGRAVIARRHEAYARAGSLRVLEADVSSLMFDEVFDVVAFWSGFGSGSERDNVRLLAQIRAYLRLSGRVCVDVFDPIWWARAAGSEQSIGNMCRCFGFDPSTSELTITCWPQWDRRRAVTERVRCYTQEEVLALAVAANLRPVSQPSMPALGREASFLLELIAE